jgi:serine/threonine protein kinase
LKTPTTIPVISNSSEIEWLPDEIGKGDSSVVKLCLDSKSVLTAVKALWIQDYVDLIQREASILKRLKHPLILKHQRDISDASDHNSSIVIKFSANGSLATHLTSSDCRLRGANRITKVVVGIALAMRYLHSQDVIHCDLNPDNILLDFDWNVQISDFDHSISPDNPKSPSLVHSNSTAKWPSGNFHHVAPECYDHCCYPESDVFSFGMKIV